MTVSGISIVDSNRRLVKGWATVEVKDYQSDRIPIEVMKSAFLEYMSRGGAILFRHKGKIVGKVLHWNPEFNKEAGKEGIMIIAEINKQFKFDDLTWNAIKENAIKGFSVGGDIPDPEKNVVMKEGGVQEVQKVELGEISLVVDPANPYALVEETSIAKEEVRAEIKEPSSDIKRLEDLYGKDRAHQLVEVIGEEDASRLLKAKEGMDPTLNRKLKMQCARCGRDYEADIVRGHATTPYCPMCEEKYSKKELTKEELKCSCGAKAGYICECGTPLCGEDTCECGGSVYPLERGLKRGIKPRIVKELTKARGATCVECGTALGDRTIMGESYCDACFRKKFMHLGKGVGPAGSADFDPNEDKKPPQKAQEIDKELEGFVVTSIEKAHELMTEMMVLEIPVGFEKKDEKGSVIGHHKTYAEALAQHRAIMANKAKEMLKLHRPPKDWWDRAYKSISNVTDTPRELTGWVWYHHKKHPKGVEKEMTKSIQAMQKAYTDRDFKTKKELKEAVARGDRVTVYQPNADLFGGSADPPTDGVVYLEGPHYPRPHTWYAEATLKNGIVVKVKELSAEVEKSLTEDEAMYDTAWINVCEKRQEAGENNCVCGYHENLPRYEGDRRKIAQEVDRLWRSRSRAKELAKELRKDAEYDSHMAWKKSDKSWKPTRECTAWDIMIGGQCSNCGWPGLDNLKKEKKWVGPQKNNSEKTTRTTENLLKELDGALSAMKGVSNVLKMRGAIREFEKELTDLSKTIKKNPKGGYDVVHCHKGDDEKEYEDFVSSGQARRKYGLETDSGSEWYRLTQGGMSDLDAQKKIHRAKWEADRQKEMQKAKKRKCPECGSTDIVDSGTDAEGNVDSYYCQNCDAFIEKEMTKADEQKCPICGKQPMKYDPESGGLKCPSCGKVQKEMQKRLCMQCEAMVVSSGPYKNVVVHEEGCPAEAEREREAKQLEWEEEFGKEKPVQKSDESDAYASAKALMDSGMTGQQIVEALVDAGISRQVAVIAWSKAWAEGQGAVEKGFGTTMVCRSCGNKYPATKVKCPYCKFDMSVFATTREEEYGNSKNWGKWENEIGKENADTPKCPMCGHHTFVDGECQNDECGWSKKEEREMGKEKGTLLNTTESRGVQKDSRTGSAPSMGSMMGMGQIRKAMCSECGKNEAVSSRIWGDTGMCGACTMALYNGKKYDKAKGTYVSIYSEEKELQKAQTYMRQGKQPPTGGQVQQGKRGGVFYKEEQELQKVNIGEDTGSKIPKPQEPEKPAQPTSEGAPSDVASTAGKGASKKPPKEPKPPKVFVPGKGESRIRQATEFATGQWERKGPRCDCGRLMMYDSSNNLFCPDCDKNSKGVQKDDMGMVCPKCGKGPVVAGGEGVRCKSCGAKIRTDDNFETSGDMGQGSGGPYSS